MEYKNTNKRAWIILIILFVIIAIAAIVANNVLGNNPERTVDEVFKALKKGSINSLNIYSLASSASSLEDSLGSDLIGDTDDDSNKTQEEELLRSCFTQLEWKIVSSKIDGDSAIVNVEVTNKDFSKIINEYFTEIFTKALSSSFTDEEMTEEEMLNIFKQKIDGITETRTITEDIDMVRENGMWKLNEENIEYILLPGFAEGMESFTNSLNDLYSSSYYDDYYEDYYYDDSNL